MLATLPLFAAGCWLFWMLRDRLYEFPRYGRPSGGVLGESRGLEPVRGKIADKAATLLDPSACRAEIAHGLVRASRIPRLS